MKFYDELINKLVKEEVDNIGENKFLSIYLPIDFPDKKNIKKEIKSILDSFKFNKIINNGINRKIDEIKDFQKGLACFIKLDQGIKEKQDIVLIPLIIRPERNLYLGKVYNLNQLVWINNFSPNALILNINQDKARFYKLEGMEMCLLSEMENEFIEDIEKQTLRKLSMGIDKAEKDKLEVVKNFLYQVEENIKNKIKPNNNFNYLAVVYSSTFKDLVCSFTDKVSKLFSNSKILILIDKNIYNEEILKETVYKKIKRQERMIKRKLLKNAQDKHNNYAFGWLKVVQAVNKNQVKTLFIKTNSKIKGYILGKKYIYFYPIKGAIMVKNIVPWIIRNLINSSGKIVIFKNRRKEVIPEIAAQLRY